MDCDQYGWAIYMQTGEVQPYDDKIDTGRYHVGADEKFALEDNGWYCDSVVVQALTYVLTTPEYEIQV